MYQHLAGKKREFILSKQVLRSGTSIGANIKEANGGQSDKDFYAKMMIAYKESLETEYWLMLLRDSGYLGPKATESMLKDCLEIQNILGSIKKTMRERFKD